MNNAIERIFYLMFAVIIVWGGSMVFSAVFDSDPATAAPIVAIDLATDHAIEAAPNYGGQCCYNPWQVFRGVACYEKSDGEIGELIRWGPHRQDRYQDFRTGETLVSPEIVACRAGS